MAIEGLITIILFLFEDLFVWWGSTKGISFWVIISISAIVFLLFYRQIFAFVKGLLRRIGI